MVSAWSRRLFRKERARTDTADAMYRLVIPVLLSLGVAIGAPQDTKSDESYVKIEPVNETIFQNATPALSEPVRDSENNNSKRQIQNVEATTLDQSEPTTETADAEPVTEIKDQADQAVQSADEIKTRTKTPSPRFYSKLSYFQKPNYASGSSAKNVVERNGKRKFKSRCRCEKIWNCPKLQITVPRCPDEYFLCCF